MTVVDPVRTNPSERSKSPYRSIEPNQPIVTSAAERFLSAWKTLESELLRRYKSAQPLDRSDMGWVLRWAERTHLLSSTATDFAFRCRDARNAYAHICFDGYEGPVTNPPLEVTYRLERIGAALRDPAQARRLAPVAVVCESNSRLDQALTIMRINDYSQLPYLHNQHGWLLVTREQVSRWLEVEADADGTALVHLGVTVGSLADNVRVGPVRPRTVPRSATVARALEQLESALCTPDSEDGGYSLVLILPTKPNELPRVLTSDDLPRMYELLGR